MFAGGCTLAAADAVSDAQLDTLQALVDRSLVKANSGRYWMLETVRKYALGRLEQQGEPPDLRRRHAHWFVQLLETRSPRNGPTPPSVAQWLDPERENFRSALEWAADTQDSETIAD